MLVCNLKYSLCYDLKFPLEHIENHQTEQIPMKSEGTQFGNEIGTHPQEVPIRTEVYQGNDMTTCR